MSISRKPWIGIYTYLTCRLNRKAVIIAADLFIGMVAHAFAFCFWDRNAASYAYQCPARPSEKGGGGWQTMIALRNKMHYN
jgi:hypothetical protein